MQRHDESDHSARKAHGNAEARPAETPDDDPPIALLPECDIAAQKGSGKDGAPEQRGPGVRRGQPRNDPGDAPGSGRTRHQCNSAPMSAGRTRINGDLLHDDRPAMTAAPTPGVSSDPRKRRVILACANPERQSAAPSSSRSKGGAPAAFRLSGDRAVLSAARQKSDLFPDASDRYRDSRGKCPAASGNLSTASQEAPRHHPFLTNVASIPDSGRPRGCVLHVSPAITGNARVSVPVVTTSPAASGWL